jgi:protein-disulfide reductase (glutathione)
MRADEDPSTGTGTAPEGTPTPGSGPAEPAAAASAASPLPAPLAPPARSGQERQEQGWNAAQIDWQPFDGALQRARAEHKPVCLVFYTTWCPHCRAFSHVFEDPRIVERAKRFSMVRLDADKESALASRYAPDGPYIPRTFFLSADGTIDSAIRRDRPKYQYFYDERDPGSLLAAMDTALAGHAR